MHNNPRTAGSNKAVFLITDAEQTVDVGNKTNSEIQKSMMKKSDILKSNFALTIFFPGIKILTALTLIQSLYPWQQTLRGVHVYRSQQDGVPSP